MSHRLLEEFDSVSVGWFWETDRDHRFTFFSKRNAEITGMKAEDMLGRRRDQLMLQTADPEQLRAHLADLAAHRPFRDLTYQASRADGSLFWVRICGDPFFDEDGAFLGYRGSGVEVTAEFKATAEADAARAALLQANAELEATSAQLREDVERLAQQESELRVAAHMFEQVERIAGVGVWEVDLQTQAVRHSPQVRKIYEMDDGVEPTLEIAKGVYPPGALATVEAALAEAIETGEPYDIVTEFVSLKGRRRRVRSIGEVDFENGAAKRVFGTFQDVTLEQERSELIERLAREDSLTGLANRGTFRQKLNLALGEADANGSSVVVAMLDLDDFKLINDSLGHAAGDAVLKELARRLGSFEAPESLVARLGGDEFALFLPTNDPAALLETTTDDLCAVFREPVAIDQTTVEMRGSVGVAAYPADASCLEELLLSVDLALYDAKAKGSGCARFERSMSDHVQSKIRLRQDVGRALDERRLAAHYQPIVCLQSQRILGFEALARWMQPANDPIAASAFFELFDDPVIGPRITARMIENVLQDLGRWRRDGLAFGFTSINFTQVDLVTGVAVGALLDGIAREGLEPKDVIVEITENTALSGSGDLVRSQIDRLSDAGIGIALDDFGTGFASLSHLKSLPVDVVKIDKSFVRDVPNAVENTAIVEAIASLGKKLGYRIVAEGVEEEAQRAVLERSGCQCGQGFMFSKAVPETEARAMLKSARPLGEATGPDACATARARPALK